MDQLEIKTGIQVLKPASEVFDAIVNPEKMKNYFIGNSSGFMKEGELLKWSFPEMDMEFEIKVGEIKTNEYISYYWDGAMDGEQTLVEMYLEQVDNNKTFVRVTEKTKTNNEAGIKWLKSNTEGWANFLACLKAWLEYGVHLRKGAFRPADMPG